MNRNASQRLTSFVLLQGVHAGEVAGQRLEGGGEAAPALRALHGAPRSAGAPQALPAHLGRRPAFPAVQDARRLGGWGAATAAFRGPGWRRGSPASLDRRPGPPLCWGVATRTGRRRRAETRRLAGQDGGVVGRERRIPGPRLPEGGAPRSLEMLPRRRPRQSATRGGRRAGGSRVRSAGRGTRTPGVALFAPLPGAVKARERWLIRCNTQGSAGG